MIEIHHTETVPYTDEQMFKLVNNVHEYPEFLPGCSAAEVLSESDTEMTAKLTLKLGFITHAFTTKNQLESPKKIVLSLVEGPFKSLNGEWVFEDLSTTTQSRCRVTFYLHCTFSNHFLAKAFEKVFQPITDRFVKAFIERAALKYNNKID